MPSLPETEHYKYLCALRQSDLPQYGQGWFVFDGGWSRQKVNYHFGVYEPTPLELDNWLK